jgi:hypothetical protein
MHENKAILRHLNQVANPVLLVLLLGADLAFLLLHIFNKLSPMPSVLFDLSKEDGYSEMFQHIKEYWIAIVLFAMYWRTREGIYGTWALLFTYALCDDALAVHEEVGKVVVRQWNYVPALGLQARDLGELTVSVIVGSAFLMLITYFYLRSSNNAKNVSKDLALLFGILVFFGVFVDMMNAAVPVTGLTMIEESGEMATMSMITAYVVRLLERRGHVSGSLWQLTKAVLTRNTLLVTGYK